VLALLVKAPLGAKEVPYEPDFEEDERVQIYAETMSYDQTLQVYRAQGDVEVIQGDRVLKADKVVYSVVTKDAEAAGDVSLVEGEDVLTCDAMKLNLETQMGSLDEATIYLKKDNFHITGKHVERYGPSSFRVAEGTLTTCDAESAPWKIAAKKIDVTFEGYAQMRDASLSVKDVPILYAPYSRASWRHTSATPTAKGPRCGPPISGPNLRARMLPSIWMLRPARGLVGE
jgi:lipopolysaccharide assembly outer membrane protein LptD (OstA)